MKTEGQKPVIKTKETSNKPLQIMKHKTPAYGNVWSLSLPLEVWLKKYNPGGQGDL